MREIFQYIYRYFTNVPRIHLVCCALLTSILVFLNYGYHLETWLTSSLPLPFPDFTGHYILFLTAFAIPYLLYKPLTGKNYLRHRMLLFLVVVAPALFALKMSMNTDLPLSTNAPWNDYWNKILYWPIRVVTLTFLLLIIWNLFDKKQPFYGLTAKNLHWRPYFIMLAIMIPLIALASTQADFLAAYPKLHRILPLPESAAKSGWFYQMLFELSYGSDFFSIELFFRGFLILAFLRWAGKDAILPMACFYCTIHFGKPLGECISSWFGGIILGIVVANTRSLYGGLMIHLGIAWLMELAAILQHAAR